MLQKLNMAVQQLPACQQKSPYSDFDFDYDLIYEPTLWKGATEWIQELFDHFASIAHAISAKLGTARTFILFNYDDTFEPTFLPQSNLSFFYFHIFHPDTLK